MSNKKQERTLDEILDSDLLNEIIQKEDDQLKESGWTRSDVNEMANFIIKNKK